MEMWRWEDGYKCVPGRAMAGTKTQPLDGEESMARKERAGEGEQEV